MQLIKELNNGLDYHCLLAEFSPELRDQPASEAEDCHLFGSPVKISNSLD